MYNTSSPKSSSKSSHHTCTHNRMICRNFLYSLQWYHSWVKSQASSFPTWLPEQSLDLVYLILLLSTRGRSLDVVVTASLITPDVTPDEVKLYFYSVAPSSINYWSTCRVTVYYTECLTESQKVTIHTFKILSLLTSFINNKYFFWQN